MVEIGWDYVLLKPDIYDVCRPVLTKVRTLLPVRVDILELGSHGNLIVPDLTKALVALHIAVVMPAVRIQSHTKLENAVIINGCGSVVSLNHLVSVEPNLEESRAVTGPLDLQNYLVPLSRTDLTKVSKGVDVPTAVRLAIVASHNSREQLIPLHPHHGTRHPVISTAACSRAVGNELGDVVGLVLEVPRVGETKCKAIEGRIAAFVAVVVVDLGVVAVVVVGVVGLCHLESRAALIDDVGNLVNGSLVLFANIVPAVESAGIVKRSGGQRSGGGDDSQGGSDDMFDGNHDEDER